jgi:predicted RNase H-like HicB family nuclease
LCRCRFISFFFYSIAEIREVFPPEERMNKVTIVFQECEEGGFSAYIKEFPGAISEGETAMEAANNVFDALVQLLAAQAEEQLKNLDKAPHEVELAFS